MSLTAHPLLTAVAGAHLFAAPAPGTPVPPIPTVPTYGPLEIYAAGDHGGGVVDTAADLAEMVANFDLLSVPRDGSAAAFEVPIKLGHDKAQVVAGSMGLPNCGTLATCSRQGDKITGTFRNLPVPVASLIAGGHYNSVSIEYEDGKVINGVPYGKVIVAVSILGAELPRVKNLAALPTPTFSDQPLTVHLRPGRRVSTGRGTTVCFSEVQPMIPNRDQLNAALEANAYHGFPKEFWDKLSDAQVGEAVAAKPGGGKADPPKLLTLMSDPGVVISDTPPVTPPVTPAVPAVAAEGAATPTPAAVAKLMSDMTALQTQLARAQQVAAVLERSNADRLKAATDDRINRFCDELTTPDAYGRVRALPAHVATVRDHLSRCDTVTVHTFADGAKGSELDRAMNSYRAQPAVHSFAEKLPGEGDGVNVQVTDAERRRLLGGHPLGDKILASAAK